MARNRPEKTSTSNSLADYSSHPPDTRTAALSRNDVVRNERNATDSIITEKTVEGSRHVSSPPSGTLFESIKQPSEKIADIAKRWVCQYQKNEKAAFVDLLSCILRAGGVNHPIPADVCQSATLIPFLRSLPTIDSKFFEEEPFKVKKGLRVFKSRYAELWTQIMLELITIGRQFDENFNDSISTVLIELSGGRIRSLRFVACFVAMHVSSEWIAGLKAKTEGRALADQQLRNVQSRQRNASATAADRRVQSAQELAETYKEQVTKLRSMILKLFNGILKKRIQDVCEMVRGITTETIGHWCLLFPSEFLNDQYLRYIAWSLSDRGTASRSAALSSLIELYGVDNNLLRLREFTRRFQSRICEMVYDVDDGVSALSVKLLTRLVVKDEVPLSSIKHVYSILTDQSSAIRNAVADLISELLMANAKAASALVSESEGELVFNGLINILCTVAKCQKKPAKATKDDTDEENWMDETRIDGDFDLNPDFILRMIRPLFSKLEVLRDWELLSKILSDEIERDKLPDGRLNIIVQSIDCCAQLTADAKPRGRKRKENKEDKAKLEMTCRLMDRLAQWINEFQVDTAKVTSFVRIIRSLQSEQFALRSSTQEYMDIMENVVEVLFKHHESEIVKECMHTIVHGASNGPEEVKRIGRDCLRLVGRQISDQTKQLLRHLGTALETADGRNELAAWLTTAERAKYMLVTESGDLFAESGIEKLFSELLMHCQSNPDLNEIAGVLICQCMFLSILRSMSEKRSATEALSEYQMQVLQVSRAILDHSANEAAKREACVFLVDFYLMFGRGECTPAALQVEMDDWIFDYIWKAYKSRLTLLRDLELNEEQFKQKQEDLAVLSKLVIYGDAKNSVMKKIGASFVSLLMSTVEHVVETVKRVVRRLQKINHHALADYFLVAMMKSFDANGESLTTFIQFAQKIAGCYHVFNNPNVRGLVHRIVSEGIDMAVTAEAYKPRFIAEGLQFFTSKLTGKSCEKLKTKLQSLCKKHRLTDDEWKVLQPYVFSLAERARRMRVAKGEKEIEPDVQDDQPGPSKPLRSQEDFSTRPSAVLPGDISQTLDLEAEEWIQTEVASNAGQSMQRRLTMNSDGVSECHVFNLDGWDVNLNDKYPPTPLSTTLPSPEEGEEVQNRRDTISNPEEGRSRSMKMSRAIRIEEDDELLSPRKKMRKLEEEANSSDT